MERPLISNDPYFMPMGNLGGVRKMSGSKYVVYGCALHVPQQLGLIYFIYSWGGIPPGAVTNTGRLQFFLTVCRV